MYDPEHPLLLKAASKLIEILDETGDYYDAERFVRICYEALSRQTLDPDSFEEANAAMNLPQTSCNLIRVNGSESADISQKGSPYHERT
jgi:hypothetical protein